MTPAWILDRPKKCQKDVSKASEFFSMIALDYLRSSPRSPGRLPTMTKQSSIMFNKYQTMTNACHTNVHRNVPNITKRIQRFMNNL